MVARALPQPAAAPVPADVRLMNATAGVLALVASALLLAMAFLWLARQPLFAIRAISVDGETTRNSVSTIRANAAPTSPQWRVLGRRIHIPSRNVTMVAGRPASSPNAEPARLRTG